MSTEKTIQTRIQNKHATEKEWLESSFVPLLGELIVYSAETADTALPEGREVPYTYSRFKIGDGLTVVNDLPFVSPIAEGISNFSTVEGLSTIAGLRAFGIERVDRDTNTIYLYEEENIETELAKISAGDVYSVRFQTQAYDFSKVTEIDVSQRSIKVEELYGAALRTDTHNTIFFFAKPDAGTRDIGQGSHAEGYLTEAYYQSHAEGYATRAYGRFSHTEGIGTEAGYCSHAEGQNSIARGEYAHTEGFGSNSEGNYSHSEGTATNALGTASHAEGGSSRVYTGDKDPSVVKDSWVSTKDFTASAASYSHAEGNNTLALGYAAHSEGITTFAEGQASHAEGRNTRSSGENSHAEGSGTAAIGTNSHAEGSACTAEGTDSHAEGIETKADGAGCHAEGHQTVASSSYAHAEGGGTEASGNRSHAEGFNTKATYEASHAEGYATTASGGYSHAEGQSTVASGGNGAHAEGWNSKAIGNASHAEGLSSTSEGAYSHAENQGTIASGNRSHAEGWSSQATNESCHAEGRSTVASGANGAHAEGYSTKATAEAAHAEGYGGTAGGAHSHVEGTSCQATAARAHAEGFATRATADSQHVQGKYNVPDTTMAHIVGGGSSDSARRNIHTIDWSGNAYFAGDLTVGGTINGFNGGSTSTLDMATGTLKGDTEIWTYKYVQEPGAASGNSGYRWAYETTVSDVVGKADEAYSCVKDLQTKLGGDLYSVTKTHYRNNIVTIPSNSMNYASVNTLGGRARSGSKSVEKSLRSSYEGYLFDQQVLVSSSFDETTKQTTFSCSPNTSTYTGDPLYVRMRIYDDNMSDLKVRFKTYSKQDDKYVYDAVNGTYLYDEISNSYIESNTTHVPNWETNKPQKSSYAGLNDYNNTTKYRFSLELAKTYSVDILSEGRTVHFYYKKGSTNVPLSLAKINKEDNYFCINCAYDMIGVRSAHDIVSVYFTTDIVYDDGHKDEYYYSCSFFDGKTNICVSPYEISKGTSSVYSFNFGVLTTNWKSITISFPLLPGFNLSDSASDTYELSLSGTSNNAALFIENQWVCELGSQASATISKKSSATEDLKSVEFMLFSSNLIDKLIPSLNVSVRCVYSTQIDDYSPVVVDAIAIGRNEAVTTDLIVPTVTSTDWGLTYSGGAFSLNGTLSSGEYIIPIKTFNLSRSSYTFSVKGISGSNNSSDYMAFIMLGDSFSGGHACAQLLPKSNYIETGDISPANLAILGADVTYFKLQLFENVTFNNFKFSVNLEYTDFAFVETRRYDIPEAVKSLEGYGLGGIRDANRQYVYNYINFESLTFVRKCKLEGYNIYELTEPETVDVSAYFTDGDIDVSNATMIKFINNSNEDVHSDITYQIKNY